MSDWKFIRSKTGFETTETQIEFVSELIECVNFKWDEWYRLSKKKLNKQEKLPWFRGVTKVSHVPVPRIYRGKKTINWEYAENEAVDMQAEFARRAKPFLRQRFPLGIGEYLHLMQHYGLPTRLLDWTESAMIALFFAIATKPKTPCLWMLNPSWLNYVNDVTRINRKTKEDKSLVLYTGTDAVGQYTADKVIRKHYFDEHKLAKYPVAVFPPHVDPRIVAQKSVFTIHGKDRDGFYSLLKKHGARAQVCMLKISANPRKISNMVDELSRLGVTETTVFPDLEGLSREIKAEYGITEMDV
jgi:hypothetical protein